MASWIIDGVEVNAESVEFSDIKAGDEIIHLVVPDDDSGNVFLWGGVVREFNAVRKEWFGSTRYSTQGNDYWNTPFTPTSVASTEDNENSLEVENTLLIAAEWHGWKSGHSLYRVIVNV